MAINKAKVLELAVQIKRVIMKIDETLLNWLLSVLAISMVVIMVILMPRPVHERFDELESRIQTLEIDIRTINERSKSSYNPVLFNAPWN